MLIELTGSGLLNERLYHSIRSKIIDGRLARGARLPSSRTLARELCVSRNVVVAAYENLIAEGYLETRHGSGTYVSSLPDSYFKPIAAPSTNGNPAPGNPHLSKYARRLGLGFPEPVGSEFRRPAFDFRYGHPALDLLPHRVWRSLVSRRVASLSPADAGYGAPEGHPELRAAVAAYLRAKRGVECDTQQVVIVNGSQQALDLVARVLIDSGDVVATEEPCYPGLRKVLVGAGAQVCPVRVDQEGMVVEDLKAISGPVRLVCVTPSHQYPTGAVMPLSRRLELVSFARRKQAFVLEDDYDSEFRFGTRLERALQGLDPDGRVIYVGTFSKVLFPALRIGYVVLPHALVAHFSVAKSVSDRYTSTCFQMVLADFIAEGHFERHLRRVRREVSQRRQALIEGLGDEFGDRIRIFGAYAGVHLLVQFLCLSHQQVREGIERASALGVAAYSADACYGAPPHVPSLVLGYASMPAGRIREGTRRLGKAFGQGLR